MSHFCVERHKCRSTVFICEILHNYYNQIGLICKVLFPHQQADELQNQKGDRFSCRRKKLIVMKQLLAESEADNRLAQ
jgi:hypothetical protein